MGWSRWTLRFWWLLGILLAVGCGRGGQMRAVLPAPDLLAVAPTITPSLTPSLTPVLSPTPTGTPTPPLTPTPLPVGRPVSPNQLAAVGDAPPQSAATVDFSSTLISPLEWRPPPLPVPLSIHPDDHYWLARPIPSGSRNYDLEWYPYGNDVNIPQLAPYRIHHGLDYPNPPGTPVLAASSGTVVWAGPRPSPRDGINYYGNTIIIKHDWQWRGQNVYTLYAHTLEMFVQVGDYVEQGQLLAGVGESGYVSGPHLHFEVRIGANQYFDTRNAALWLAPYEGWGTLAGQFVDRRGEPISGAGVLVRPLNVDTPIRQQRTYMDRRLIPDEVWNENFVVGDLPAGRYKLELTAVTEDDLIRKYERIIDVLPGRTNFTIVQADFIFVPTPTPEPTETPTPDGTTTAEPEITPTAP